MIGSGYERRDSAPEGAGAGGQRLRVYELAKELNVPHKDLVAKIKSLGIEIANHMSHLEPTDADRVRRALDRERHETLVEQRVTDTVIRRRSRTAAPAPRRPRQPPQRPQPPGPLRPRPPPHRPAGWSAPSPRPSRPPPPSRGPLAGPRSRRLRPAAAARPEVVEAPAPAAPSPPPAPRPRCNRESSARPRRRRPRLPRRRPRPRSHRVRPVVAPPPPAPAPAPVAAAPAPVPHAPMVPSMPEPAASAAPNAPHEGMDSRPVLKTIAQPVITGSAATGAFIQLPGRAPPGVARASRSRTATRSCAAWAAPG